MAKVGLNMIPTPERGAQSEPLYTGDRSTENWIRLSSNSTSDASQYSSSSCRGKRVSILSRVRRQGHIPAQNPTLNGGKTSSASSGEKKPCLLRCPSPCESCGRGCEAMMVTR